MTKKGIVAFKLRMKYKYGKIVYILYGSDGRDDCGQVYAVTLDSALKYSIISDYEHDFPEIRFEWKVMEEMQSYTISEGEKNDRYIK
jgi:hypothetical protein